MLKYFTNVVENHRMKKLETEVSCLRGELNYLKEQNVAMLESIENINKYEKVLVEKLEGLAQDMLTLTEEAKK